MIRAKAIVLASLLVASGACAGPSAEAGRGTSSATPAGATPAVAAPAPARVEEPRVVCEYVKRSGSNIATRECREVNHFVDDAGKKGAENWFKSGPSSPSR
jgi:hypothetical protein